MYVSNAYTFCFFSEYSIQEHKQVSLSNENNNDNMKYYARYTLLCTTLFTVYVIYKLYDFEGDKFQKYFPSVNYTALIDPHSRELKGVFTKERKVKTILLFTTHFYSEIWKGLPPDTLDDHMRRSKCRIQDCVITYDRTQISSADIIVFHAVDFNSGNFTVKHFRTLSKKRQSYQIWLFWMHETPVYYPLLESYNYMFNWTMTFSRRSDIYLPYFSYTFLSDDDGRPGTYANFALKKDKKVAWMVSHCGMTRGEYTLELQKYTDVTVYGLCGSAYDNIGGICSKVESECLKELSRYKFYLSFENSFCEDYVSEKYFKFGLIYGLVPIVMGAKYDYLNSIPGSYIDAAKFDSIEELGNYVNYLDSNDRAYNKYFEWRKHLKVTEGIDKMCLICHAAHDESRTTKTYPFLQSFWGTQSLCESHNDIKNKLDQQIRVSKKNRKAKGIT